MMSELFTHVHLNPRNTTPFYMLVSKPTLHPPPRLSRVEYRIPKHKLTLDRLCSANDGAFAAPQVWWAIEDISHPIINRVDQ